MRIESIWFGNGIYERMARVFLATAQQHCPDWKINLRNVGVRDLDRHPRALISHVANTQKMEEWNEIVQRAPNGSRLLLVDADTFFTRGITDVWRTRFDIAYTVKDSRFPFNSGVVFVRANLRVKAFFRAWTEINSEMLLDARSHSPWRQKYGGINQAAFGRMLESDAARKVRIIGLPCQEWNCEDSSWANFDPERTRIVHVKSALRRAIFSGCVLSARKPGVAAMADLWRQHEARCLEAA